MNKKEFGKAIYDTLNSYDVDLRFVNSWYQDVVNSLKLIKSKAKGIKHPRHLGDFLEDELIIVLNKLLPKRYIIDKGFLINHFSGFSQEQDLLIIDTSLGSPICKTEGVGYYPIESAIGAIEVKSNLDLSELRKCFVSCASAKKLFFPLFEYDDTPDNRFFYAIFAYTSSCAEKSFEAELVNCLDQVPEALRPNLIYILDQGLYFPTSSGEIKLDLETIQKTEGNFRIIKNTSNDDTESQNFVLFFSMLIEHAFHQSSLRKPTKYSSYTITPSVMGNNFKKTRKSEIPISKFINKYTRWSDKIENLLMVAFEETCTKCGAIYQFHVLPPGSKKMRSEIEQKFQKSGSILMPKSKKYVCVCGEKFDINED